MPEVETATGSVWFNLLVVEMGKLRPGAGSSLPKVTLSAVRKLNCPASQGASFLTGATQWLKRTWALPTPNIKADCRHRVSHVSYLLWMPRLGSALHAAFLCLDLACDRVNHTDTTYALLPSPEWYSQHGLYFVDVQEHWTRAERSARSPNTHLLVSSPCLECSLLVLVGIQS